MIWCPDIMRKLTVRLYLWENGRRGTVVERELNMSGNELERRLAPMDAFFLFGESDEAPMTMGCVAVFDGKIPFRKFVRSIDSRLHLIPRYRQKVVAAPLNIGMPTWEYDPDFDIENHIHEITLDKPGTEAQFHEMAEGLFEGKLDMERPLWEIYIVQGLEGGVSGLVARVHHAMIDGIAGVGLMMIIFDAVPDPPKIRKKPYRPGPIPDRATLLQDALWDSAIEGVKHWTKFQKSLNRYAKGRSDTQVLNSLKEFGRVFTDLLRPTQRYFFNKVFSGKHRFSHGARPPPPCRPARPARTAPRRAGSAPAATASARSARPAHAPSAHRVLPPPPARTAARRRRG